MKLFAKLSKSHSQEILTELKNKKEFINGSKKSSMLTIVVIHNIMKMNKI